MTLFRAEHKIRYFDKLEILDPLALSVKFLVNFLFSQWSSNIFQTSALSCSQQYLLKGRSFAFKTYF